jgi:hypothetical protein
MTAWAPRRQAELRVHFVWLQNAWLLMPGENSSMIVLSYFSSEKEIVD